jgi:hypothetical protein
MSLDDYVALRGISRVDIIKIDVEGGELDVVRGSKRLLNESRPTIICEVLDAAAEPWGHRALEVIRALEAYWSRELPRYQELRRNPSGAVYPLPTR